MSGLTRRTFLLGAAGAGLAACSSAVSPASGTGTSDAMGAPPTSGPGAPASTPPTSAASAPRTSAATAGPTVAAPAAGLRADPFTCGVASGDPLPDRVVLWTRAFAPGRDAAVPLAWEVATDETFATPVRSGLVEASPAHDFTVRVDADGLRPGTRYWYRFRVDGYEGRGRTRTAPAEGAAVDRLRFGFGSCQDFQGGFYAAHRDVAASDLDLFVWLGDYIYEYAPAAGAVRQHTGGECRSLADYRARYVLYRSDADLRAAHASCPWAVIWDDHEVANDYAAQAPQNGEPTAQFLARRAAAYRAWWEYMPTRLPEPDGPSLKIYRDLRWGSLAHLFLLDGRQYRSDQACGGTFLSSEPPCAEWSDPAHSMLGAEQEAWLLDGLAAPGATWRIVGNQTVLADARFNGSVLNYDMWDGYPAARERLLRGIGDAGARNVVVVTGDIHFAAVADLRTEAGTTVATELVGTSISSGAIVPASLEAAVGLFPALRYLNVRKRGWTRNTVTPDGWTAEYRVVSDVASPAATVATDATFAIAAGTPGARRA